MKAQIKNLKNVFEPNSVAIVGASTSSSKLGGVLLRNFISRRFKGKIFPINPKYKQIHGMKCYSSVNEIKEKIDCVVFAIPSKFIPKVLEECGKKGVKGAIVLSGGFAESGNHDLEEKLKQIAEKYSIALIGPNCLGVVDPYSQVDSVFFPMYKMERPKAGTISVITQSGAVGSCIIDLAAHYGVGLSKFISYGNAAVLDESDLLEFLENDPNTEQIILYIEGTKDGTKLLNTMKRVNKLKPIIVLKAGKGEKASKAAFSHTGNIAGNYLAYKAAFLQSKVIQADDLDDVFNFVKIFSQPLPRGEGIGIVTNGGGLGVLAADASEDNNLKLPEFSNETKLKIKKVLPSYANIGNPLDIVADAPSELYENSINAMMEDPRIHTILIMVLFQAPSIDERLLNILVKFSDDKRKPIAIVAVGGSYTDQHRQILESYGVPTYGDPSSAIKTIKRFTDYSLKSHCKKCMIKL